MQRETPPQSVFGCIACGDARLLGARPPIRLRL